MSTLQLMLVPQYTHARNAPPPPTPYLLADGGGASAIQLMLVPQYTHARNAPPPLPPTCWLMEEVRPLSSSCLCRRTLMRALPRPLSSSGRPLLPWVRTATREDLPLSTPPDTEGGQGGSLLIRGATTRERSSRC